MRRYIICGLVLIAVITAMAIVIKYPPYEKPQAVMIREDMSLRHIAERNDVPIHSLIPLLYSEARKDFATTFRNLHKPLRELNIDRDKIRVSILKARAEGFPTKDVIRFILWGVCTAAAGLVLLRKKHILKVRRIWLVFTLTVFGIMLGASPNPMEAFVRLHKLIKGIPGNPLILVILSFAIFTLASLIGSRMLCSWGCPLGALQENLHDIPLFKKFKRNHRFSFSASISIRMTVYSIFFLLLFNILNINQGGPGSILYHHFNLFKVFDPYELAVFTLLLIPPFLLASVLIFRPFCHTICPFGIWAWLSEKAALYQVRKADPSACVGCGLCERACPTDAMKVINTGKRGLFRPDCWSCGRCIAACPNGVLEFAARPKKKAGKSQ